MRKTFILYYHVIFYTEEPVAYLQDVHFDVSPISGILMKQKYDPVRFRITFLNHYKKG
ncbi:hypothetical protein [Neobacillus cucumis]|uniref:hypothetical protein n=1 Tax=Neobacillus cucumis TaxID=1740721 RepID=UPI0015E0F5A8|nr:hypothetical protein [Neobacillus cucumis]